MGDRRRETIAGSKRHTTEDVRWGGRPETEVGDGRRGKRAAVTDETLIFGIMYLSDAQ